MDIFYINLLTFSVDSVINWQNLIIVILFILKIMLEKIKNWFGGNKLDVAAVVRSVVHGDADQSVLFESGKERCLAAFVEYGHRFSDEHLCDFLRIADCHLIKIYLELGYEIPDEAKEVILVRQDDELSKALLDSGSWFPFPHGCCTCHNLHPHKSHAEHHDDAEGFSGHVLPA